MNPTITHVAPAPATREEAALQAAVKACVSFYPLGLSRAYLSGYQTAKPGLLPGHFLDWPADPRPPRLRLGQGEDADE